MVGHLKIYMLYVNVFLSKKKKKLLGNNVS